MCVFLVSIESNYTIYLGADDFDHCLPSNEYIGSGVLFLPDTDFGLELKSQQRILDDWIMFQSSELQESTINPLSLINYVVSSLWSNPIMWYE